MIGDEFHPTAIAVSSKIGALLGEVSEQAHAFCDSPALAAGIDDEIASLGLRAGSTERTIQRNVVSFLENRFEANFVGEAERAEFDDDPGQLPAIGDGVCHRLGSR